MGTPTESTIHDLARGIVSIQNRIYSFYEDPENEARFQMFLAAGGINGMVERMKESGTDELSRHGRTNQPRSERNHQQPRSGHGLCLLGDGD